MGYSAYGPRHGLLKELVEIYQGALGARIE
jgi:hypothetical protein